MHAIVIIYQVSIITITIIIIITITNIIIIILGVTPGSFQQGDSVSLKANKVTSTKTPLQYDYYDLPFCKKRKSKSNPNRDAISWVIIFIVNPVSRVKKNFPSPWRNETQTFDDCCVAL